jgi:hypothetical protein
MFNFASLKYRNIFDQNNPFGGQNLMPNEKC